MTDVKYIKRYTDQVAFNDASQGNVDLSSELDWNVFEPLKDTNYFKSFKLIGHTLAWDNGAYFAPEFLREHDT